MFTTGENSSSHYTSSNQAYGSGIPKWNAGSGLPKYETAGNYASTQPRTSQPLSNSGATYANGYRQNEGTPCYNTSNSASAKGTGQAPGVPNTKFAQPSNSNGIPLATLNPVHDSNSSPWKAPTLYNTGEPVGKLSAEFLEGAKGRYAPSREAMKDKLVNTLSSDANIAILPGFVKPYEETKFSASNSRPPVSLNNGKSHSWYAERVPSPVARAQAAISDTRDHIGQAQKLVNTQNSAKAAGMYSQAKKSSIIGGISAIGENQYSSVRQSLDKSSYRRDLQNQMEQARAQKEAERHAYRNNSTQHPFGPSYSAHSPHNYDLGLDTYAADRNQTAADKFVNYLRTKKDAIGQTMPSRPARQVQPEMLDPWANHLRNAPAPQQLAPVMQQQIANPYNFQQQQPVYPYAYPMYPPPQPGMPPQVANPQSQPGLPMQPGYPQYQQAQTIQQTYPQPQQQYSTPPMPPQVPSGPPIRQYPQSAAPVQIPAQFSQTHYFPPVGHLRPQQDLIRPLQNQLPKRPSTPSPRRFSQGEGMELEFDSDAEVDESLFIPKKWHTSEQLPNAALRNAAYQLALKKQILQKHKEAEIKRLKEIEDDEILERKNQEYYAKMRMQLENEKACMNILDAHTKNKLHVKDVNETGDQKAESKSKEHTPYSTVSIRPSPRESKPSPRESKPSPRESKASIQSSHPAKNQKQQHTISEQTQHSNFEHGGGDVARSKNKSHALPLEKRSCAADTQTTPRVKVSSPSSDSSTQTDDELLRIKLPAQHHADLAKLKRQKEMKLITRVQSTLDIEARRMERLLRGKVIPTSCPDITKLKHPIREFM